MCLKITNVDNVGINLDCMHTEVRNFFSDKISVVWVLTHLQRVQS